MSREWEIWDTERAEYYEETYGHPLKPKPQHGVRMKLAASLIEGDSVLDVGCGIGHLYPHVEGYTYTGVDSSPAMIGKAKQTFPDGVFKVGDIYDLSPHPVHDSTVCQSLLIHLPDLEKPVTQLWSRTRKAMVFSVPIGWRKTIKKRPMKDKYLIASCESMDDVLGFCENLPDCDTVTHVSEPGTKIGNTHFKVTRCST